MLANLAFWAWRGATARWSSDPLRDLPPVMFWAWERPEDLSSLDCRTAGIAFLAKTVQLGDSGMEVRPRMQPLRAPRGCPLVAVVRIEATDHPPLSDELAADVAQQIARLSRSATLAAIQVDFDATDSQREWYRTMLMSLEERLPADVRLTITALASWCIYDNWIRGLPIDEAVPMLFQMDVDADRVRAYLREGRDFRVDVCRWSVGISTDEPMPPVPGDRRRWVFHPRPWTVDAVKLALRGEW